MPPYYSHDFSGTYFPHTFVRLQGQVDETGEVVDTNYGFTANSLSPGLLFGSVRHKMETKEIKYIEKSKPHFTLRLDDAGYAKLMEHVAAWRDIEGKGYNLGKRNCVHFVMEAAALYGLNVNRKSKFFKKPKSFLEELMSLNPELVLIDPSAADEGSAGEAIDNEAGGAAKAAADNEDATKPADNPENIIAPDAGQTASNPAS